MFKEQIANREKSCKKTSKCNNNYFKIKFFSVNFTNGDLFVGIRYFIMKHIAKKPPLSLLKLTICWN
jgi:hypothetical protein